MSAPAVVNRLLLAYESLVPRSACSGRPDPIVVLGGGIDSRADNQEQIHYLSSASVARTLEAARLAGQYRRTSIFLSGGAYRGIAESEVMAALLKRFPLNEANIILEKSSRNTYENAREVVKLIKEQRHTGSIRLITSALHMPRAVAVFRKFDAEVCAVPVDFLGLENIPLFALLPQSSALTKFSRLLHELIAWAYYQSRGLL